MKFNALIPELSVSDIKASTYFYINILGFKLEYERAEDNFVFISYGKAQIMLQEINEVWSVGTMKKPLGRGINFQIETSNLSGLVESLHKHNIQLFKDVFESRYRENDIIHIEREILVQDLDGYLLRFSESV